MIDDTSSDDNIDERIRALATGHFNAPAGEPPRQAMWEGIAAARRAARAAAAESSAEAAPVPVAPSAISITPLAPRRSRTTAWRWAAALAAGLILGIVVDRRIAHDSSASKPAGVAVGTPTAAPVTANPSSSTPRSPIDSLPSAPRRVAVNTLTAPRLPRAAVPSPIERGGSRPLASRVPADSAAQALYRVAATQTLVQAEALLTAYRADEGTRDPQAMLQAARWARDVLSSTRLLIDSPAGRDPQMRALLTDLELILAQLVQLSGTPLQASERDLIERAMRERDLLPRLRSAVPAGLASS